jgi:hypothetical protein
MKVMNHCPACGAAQIQPTPFCRKCGADVRAVQLALDKPDILTGAAGRDEVLRAIADRFRQLRVDDEWADHVEEVLTKVEKTLETPEEKRLREIREGVNWFAIGLGLALYFVLRETVFANGSWVLLGALVALTLGLGSLINGLFFTIPRGQQKSKLAELGASASEPLPAAEPRTTDKLLAAASIQPSVAVTEETTRHLVAEPRTDKS